jgi:peptidyl-prolyl cis-trans isomerase SurA
MGTRFMSNVRQIATLLIAKLLILVLTHGAPADENPPMALASVNGETIAPSEVEQELRRAFGERAAKETERKRLERAALDQVIDRRLVLGYLTKTGQAASEQDVDLALAQLEKELKSQELTLQQHCEKTGQTMIDLRRALAWRQSWQRYLQRQLSEQNLEKYFQRYRREFDGTQLHVAQILLKLADDADEAAIAAAKERAAKLRQEIVAKSLTFSAAAKQHSQAPSAASGGDIGWIERDNGAA